VVQRRTSPRCRRLFGPMVSAAWRGRPRTR